MNRNLNLEKFKDYWNKKDDFDVIIIGGGITGAGISLGTSRNGLKTLLLEAKDFGYSASGNSSKLVHGGLRYLQHGHFHTTFVSVKERESLLKELPNLIWPCYFLLPYYNLKQKLLYASGLFLYDLFAFKKTHKNLSYKEILRSIPEIKTKYKSDQIGLLKGGYIYQDAQTDDVRLVMRTLKEAEKEAIILNYFLVRDLIIKDNKVRGVIAYDLIDKKEYTIHSKVVINACGFSSDSFREKLGLKKIIRPLRGSHIAFESTKISVPYAIGFRHPKDRRNVFVLPWFGLTVVGTTDVDHNQIMDPKSIFASTITEEEIEYLLEGINDLFPRVHLTKKDIYATWSGVRPVVSSNFSKEPSKESREMYIEFHKNLLTVTGGKLTTFRIEAKKTLSLLKRILPIKNSNLHFYHLSLKELAKNLNLPEKKLLEIPDIERILAFYGKDSENIIQNILQNPKIITEFYFYKPDNCLYEEEIHYSILNEWVMDFQDLVYHRYRIGLCKKELLPLMKRIYDSYTTGGKNE
ncbi:MAG: glycerol-3-phosphate dehydrogenase/oxidase [Leptonema sp. (in: bacteria)]